jgi:hypothetical protein
MLKVNDCIPCHTVLKPLFFHSGEFMILTSQYSEIPKRMRIKLSFLNRHPLWDYSTFTVASEKILEKISRKSK